MTYLAIRRIFDERFIRLWVPADNIRGTSFDACPATDAPFNPFDGHGFLFSSVFSLLFLWENEHPTACGGAQKINSLSEALGQTGSLICQGRCLAGRNMGLQGGDRLGKAPG